MDNAAVYHHGIHPSLEEDPYEGDPGSAAAAGLAGESALEFDETGNAKMTDEPSPKKLFEVDTPMVSAHSGISGSRYDVLIPKPLGGSAALLGSAIRHYRRLPGGGSDQSDSEGMDVRRDPESAADALQALLGPGAASVSGPTPSSSRGSDEVVRVSKRGRGGDASGEGEENDGDDEGVGGEKAGRRVRWSDAEGEGKGGGQGGAVEIEEARESPGAGASESGSGSESKDAESFHLDGDHADVLGVVFEFLDEDGDGRLSDDQLRYAVTAMGIPPTWPFLQEIKSHCVKGQGVDYPLLKRAIEQRNAREPVNCARLQALFDGFSSPSCGPGEVPTHLLRYVFSGVHTAYGTQLNDKEMDQLLEHLRIREGQRVDAVDFVRALGSGFQKMVPGSAADVAAPPPSNREQRSDRTRRQMDRIREASREKQQLAEAARRREVARQRRELSKDARAAAARAGAGHLSEGDLMAIVASSDGGAVSGSVEAAGSARASELVEGPESGASRASASGVASEYGMTPQTVDFRS